MAATDVEIASVGDYWGHPRTPHELTMGDLRMMVRNFDGPIVIDYNHATQNPEVVEAKAAGWVTDVRVEGETLVGTVDWTEDAEAAIDNDEYRFLSPVIDKEAQDRETGEPIGTELVTLALTNTPFYDHLNGEQGVKEEVSATRPVSRQMAMSGGQVVATDLGDYIRTKRIEKEWTIQELAEKVGLSESAMGAIERGEIEVPPPERRRKLADALGVDRSTLDERIPDSKLKNTDSAMDWQERWKNFKKRLSGILNTDGTEDLDLLHEARQLRERVDELEEQLEDQEELVNERDELQERVNELEDQVEEKEEIANEELLDEAVDNYRIKNSDREKWEERLEENPEAARMALNSIPKGAAKPGSDVDEPETEDGPDTLPGTGASGFQQYAQGDE